MMSTGQYSETSSSGDMYLDNRYLYARNSKAIGVLWAVFSLCFSIINMVVFVQPQWLGDTATSRGTGYFGLWRSCRLLQDGQDLICEGRLDDFSTIQTPAFRAATVFVGLSVFLSSLCVLSMVLFFFLHSSTVFHICGWIQLSCAISMMVGVLIFPIGWDTPIVREVCGNDSDSYSLGQCGIRWAFILALIGVVDSIVLSILAFVLGTRYVKLLPDHYLPNGTKYKGEVNSAFMNPEYLPNKKLIGSLHGNQMLAKPHPHPHHHHHHTHSHHSHSSSNHSHHHHHHHPHSHLASPPGYLSGFGSTNTNSTPSATGTTATTTGNGINSIGGIGSIGVGVGVGGGGGSNSSILNGHTTNLNEIERFSEYSQRTNRSSSYKSNINNGILNNTNGTANSTTPTNGNGTNPTATTTTTPASTASSSSSSSLVQQQQQPNSSSSIINPYNF